MAIRVAINGFGRIGRLTFRNLMSRSDEFDGDECNVDTFPQTGRGIHIAERIVEFLRTLENLLLIFGADGTSTG